LFTLSNKKKTDSKGVETAQCIENEIADRIKESFSSKSITIKNNIIEVNNHSSINNPHQMIKTLQDTKSSQLMLISSRLSYNPKQFNEILHI